MKTAIIAASAIASLAAAYIFGRYTNRSIHTDILIDAPKQIVWEYLTNTAEYADWNPFIREINGDLTAQNTISVAIAPPDSIPMNFTPEVLKFEQNQELRWIGIVGLKGIFNGEHYFILEDAANGKTLFRHGEYFSGMITIPLLFFIKENTRKGFIAMNNALKKRVEAR